MYSFFLILSFCSTRRFIWNLFRLENEQLKNCDKCCAVRDFWNIWRHLEKDRDVLSEDHHKITTHGTICCLPLPNQRLLSGQLLNLFHQFQQFFVCLLNNSKNIVNDIWKWTMLFFCRVKETKLPAGGTDAEIRPCI